MKSVPHDLSELNEDGVHVSYSGEAGLSMWQLEGDERERLLAGGRIGLVIEGDPLPQVYVAIAAPYCAECGALMGWNETLGAYSCTAHEVDPQDDLS